MATDPRIVKSLSIVNREVLVAVDNVLFSGL
jgi:hypothetical protein